MSTKTLHITNGMSLTEKLNELGVEGIRITWQEMLCEGPTVEHLESDEFIAVRRAFLSEYYDIIIDENEYREEIGKLDARDSYEEIVLWFEYDLFCHINLLGVIHLIQTKKIDVPIYLVCSGRVKGEKDFKGLAELSQSQLLQHYDRRIPLNSDDVDLASTLWCLYCGIDHNLIKPYIVKTSSFEYLNSCLKAHLKRFPDSKSGLGRLEQHILETIKLNTIKSRHHLLGYILNYQGYYGYGDIQIMRMIEKLTLFFDETEDLISLNREGHQALLGQHNYAQEIDNDLYFGGVKRLDFQFHKESNKLIKTIINAH